MAAVRRFGQVIRVKADKVEEYEAIHAAVWPEVLELIHRYGMRNYSIFRHGLTLFAYFEYVGEDFDADMAALAKEPKNMEWWTHTDPMQEPVEDVAEGEWWHAIPEVFHTD